MPLNRVPVCFLAWLSYSLPRPMASGSETEPITGSGIALQMLPGSTTVNITCVSTWDFTLTSISIEWMNGSVVDSDC